MKKTVLYLLLFLVFHTMTTKAQVSYGDYETFSPNFVSFGTTAFDIVTNPNSDSSGINISNFVGHYVSSIETYEGISVTLDGEVDLASGNTFTMKVYAPVGTTVNIQLENAKSNEDYCTSSASYTTPGQWQELTFNMGPYSTEQYYDRLLIFFDYPNTTDGYDWYFDDIVGPPLVETKKQTLAYALNGSNITIDGVIDSEWDNAPQYDAATFYNNETFDNPEDLTAYWKAGYDASGIYVLVHVTADDFHVTDYTYGAGYEQDRVEVYFDMNVGNLNDGIGPSDGNGHYQATILSENGSGAYLSGGSFNGQNAVLVNGDNSYVHELFIPWSDLLDESWNIFSPDGVSKIGFDVNIADNDGIENGAARNRKVWANNGGEPNYAENWFNMDYAGEMFFVPDTVIQADRDALITIYNALGGVNWINNSNWNTSVPVSAWYGVRVEANRVTELNLSYNNLVGTLPQDIGNLTELTALSLDHNQISGTLPSELWNLINLTHLDFWVNELTGTIPVEIGNLINLQFLGLSNNQFTGSIPAQIGNLNGLQKLYLNENQLSGFIPSELGDLTNLQILYLRNNQLSGSIPIELGNLTNLQTLYLHNNQLSGTIPSELGSLISLKYLSFWENQLTGAIPVEIGNLTNLELLSFSNNQFTDLPDLSALTALTSLYLNGNLFDYTDLETANVNWASITTGVYAPQNTEANIIRTDAADITLSCNIGGTANVYQWQNFGADLAGETDSTLVLPLEAVGSYDLMLTHPNFPDLSFDFTQELINYDPGVSQAEYDALLALYNSTVGTNWNNNTNWNTVEPVQNWFGVSVSGGQVIGLDLNNNNLNGNIPLEIGDLTNLTFLNLIDNQLTGEIPVQVANLTNLTQLILGGNQLSGSIPSELGNLPNLMDLALYGNQLTGNIPTSIGNLANLVTLNCSSNQLSGSIPAELGLLSNLTELYIGANQLSGNIPMEIGDLLTLTTLDLGGNQLTGSIPTEIGNLTSLTNLWLCCNQLSGSILTEICGMSNLVNLDLSGNQLSENIPTEIGNLTSLVSLELLGNQLSGSIPAEIGNLTNLTTLRLEDNQFTGMEVLDSVGCSPQIYNNYLTFAAIEPNIGFFTDLNQYSPQNNVPLNTSSIAEPAGTNVSLSLSTLTDSVDLGGANNLYQWFRDGESLTDATTYKDYDIAILDASHEGSYYCEITNSAVPGLVLTTESISINLSTSQADFDALVAFYNATGGDGWNDNTGWNTTTNNVSNDWYGVTVSGGHVTELNLNSNNLNGTIPPEIAGLINLETLSLRFNGLYGNIPAEIGSLANLKNLSIGGNQLTGGIPAEIWGMINLELLSVSDNQLEGEIPTAIGNLTNLTSLFLWGNQLTGEIPTEIGLLTSLTRLFLHTNQLTGGIPLAIGNLTNLTSLNLSTNQLTGEIPTTIGNLSNLATLQLAQNQLTGNIPSEIGNLSVLQGIWLDDNQFSGSIPTEIANMSNLSELYFGGNQLSGNIPAEIVSMPNLGQLNLQDNQFTGMDVLDSINCWPNIFNNYLTFAAIEPNIEFLTDFNQYSPQYNVPLNTSSITEPVGTSVTLNVIALTDVDLGGANNLYQWFKDGGSVSDATSNPEYLIDSLDESTGGDYYCEITNTAVDGLTLTTDIISVNSNISSTEFDALVAIYNATGGDGWHDNSGWDISTNNVSNDWFGVTVSGGHVTELSLRSNNLTGTIPPEIADLTNLTYLVFEDNQLSGDIPVEIGSLIHLTQLSLGGNQLTGSIPVEIFNLTNLMFLQLFGNQLTEGIPVEIGNLENLIALDLGNNPLSGIIPLSIGNLTNLTELFLYGNQLSGEIPDTIGNMTSLEMVYCGGNQLSGIIPSSIGNLNNLRELHLNHNQLSGEIPLEIGDLTNLEMIVLHDNQFTGNIPEAMVSLPNLWQLVLYNNQFSGMDALSSANCSPEVFNNNLLFDAIEPNLAFFADENFYSPQNPVPVNNAFIEPLGTTITLNVDTLTDVDLSGANNLYQWFKDWESVTDLTTNPEYVINSLDISNEGNYYCEISNNSVPGLVLRTENVAVNLPVDQAEFDVLLAIYNATGGDNWNNNSGWNTTTNDVSNAWHGITVSGGHVTGINLTNNNLINTIPEVIGDLTNLTELNLSNNQLSGNIPMEIGNLITLTNLYLHSNQLTGEIPPELGNLNNLTILYLHRNQLTGEIPKELGSLSSLLTLALVENQLTGSIPAELGNLASLDYLWLYTNQLSGSIPESIGNLTNLRYLVLRDNQLSGEIPTQIGDMINLTYIDLQSNQITGNIPAEIGSLTNLQWVEMNHNQLTGSIPVEMGNCISLGSLILYDNQLSGNIPEEVVSLPNLYELLLFENQFNSMDAITSANCSPEVHNNYLTFAAIEPNVGYFADPSHYNPQKEVPLNTSQIVQQVGTSVTLNINALTDADLGGNLYQWFNDGGSVSEISSNPEYIIDSLYESTEGNYRCEISNSAVPDLVLFSENVNVTFNISSTEFDALVAFYNATGGDNWNNNSGWNTTVNNVSNDWHGITISGGHVTEISLGSNNLNGIIPPEIGDLPNLTFLNLSNNELTGEIPADMGSLTNLTHLYLHYNKFTGELPVAICNLPNLSVLYLHYNQLNGSIPVEIGNLENLTALALIGNQLSGEIPVQIGDLTNLSYLYLYYNQLEGEIPAEIGDLSNLVYLGLFNNQLSGSIPREIGDLTNLRTLRLENNQLSGIIPAEIGNLGSLAYLNLSNNEFTGMEVLDSINCSPQIQNNYLTFAAIEPNIGFFTDINHYSPQYPVPVNTSQIVEPVGTPITLNINTLTDADLGGNLYQWFKDGASVPEGITSSPEYAITNLDVADQGLYYCQITNIAVGGLTLESEQVSIAVLCSTFPVTQASNFQELTPDAHSTEIGWTSGTDNVLVLMRQGLAIEHDPITGLSYNADPVYGNGDMIGDAFVVFNGVGESATVTELWPGTEYHFAVYKYDDGELCYNTEELTGSIVTLGCRPEYTTGSVLSDYIEAVELGDINNVSGASAAPFYTYYSNMSTTLETNSTHQINITGGAWGPDYYAAWIDYNQDNAFSLDEKLGEFQLMAFETNSFEFTVPADAIEGTTTLRVKSAYYGENMDACANYDYGETEDYPINIELASYNVTFNVSDGTIPIDGAAVSYNETVQNTDAAGTAVFTDVLSGTTAYTISKAAYHDANGSINLDSDISQDVIMVDSRVAIDVFANPSAYTAEISWTGSGADNYLVFFTAAGATGFEYVYSSSSPKTISVMPLTTYTVTVKSLLNGQWSDHSDPVEFTTLDVALATYNVTFNVTDGTNPIDGASVTYNGSTQITDVTGVTVFTGVSSGNTAYSISNAGYYDASGSINVGSDISESVVMVDSRIATDLVAIPNAYTAEISWTGSGADNYLVFFTAAGATGFEYVYSSSSPKIITVMPLTTYTVTVKSLINGQWSDHSDPVVFTTLDVALASYSVTFNVGDGANPIDGASVTYNGSTQITDVSGVTVFTGVSSGNTTYSISNAGYYDASGTVNVVDRDISEGVVMVDSRVASDLVANPKAYTAEISWTGSGADSYLVFFTANGATGFEYVYSSSSPKTISVMPLTTYTVTVKSLINGQWSAHSDPVEFTTLDVALASYSVTFNVGDGANPIDGASVTYNGSTQITDVSGVTVFTGVSSGNTAYSISNAGYYDASGTVNVVDRDISEGVVMVDSRVASDLVANPKAYTAEISWTGSGADNYLVFFTANGATGFEYVYSSSSPKTISVMPLTTYTVTVKSLINGQWSAHSDPVEFTTLDVALATYNVTFNVTDGTNPIDGASVTYNGSTQITDVTGVTVFTGVSTGNTAYSISNAGYYDASGSINVGSDISESVVMVDSRVVTDVVANPNANTAEISWTGSGADNYLVFFTAAGATDFEYVYSSSSPTTITVKPSTTYTVTVKSLINGKWSGHSDPVVFTSNAGVQQLAENIVITNIGANSADVTWTGSGAEKYLVFYTAAGATDFEYRYSSSSPTTISVMPSTTYTVTVKSLINGQWSSHSDPVDFTSQSLPAPPVSTSSTTGNGKKDENMLEELPIIKVSTIYPNPAKDVVSIDLLLEEPAEIKVAIIDINGRTLKLFERYVINQTESFNISELASGVYFIKINSNNFSEIQRFIKQ